jgi:signal peptidase I
LDEKTAPSLEEKLNSLKGKLNTPEKEDTDINKDDITVLEPENFEQSHAFEARLLQQKKKRFWYKVKRFLLGQQSADGTKNSTIEFFKTTFSALALALLIRSFLYQPFNIPSESMLPTLLVGDFIFVSKFSYGYSNVSFPFSPNILENRIWSTSPQRGDVAVFRVPSDGNKDYIKRIIGIPGDKIQMYDGILYLNRKPIPRKFIGYYGEDTIEPSTVNARIYEETLPNGVTYQTLDVRDHDRLDTTLEFVVPEGHYFALGDNRDNSSDSRDPYGYVHFIHEKNMIGKANIIFFSLKDANFIEFWKWAFSIRYSRLFDSIN